MTKKIVSIKTEAGIKDRSGAAQLEQQVHAMADKSRGDIVFLEGHGRRAWLLEIADKALEDFNKAFGDRCDIEDDASLDLCGVNINIVFRQPVKKGSDVDKQNARARLDKIIDNSNGRLKLASETLDKDRFVVTANAGDIDLLRKELGDICIVNREVLIQSFDAEPTVPGKRRGVSVPSHTSMTHG